MKVSLTTWKDWQICGIDGMFVVKNLAEVRSHFEDLEKADTPKIAIDMTKTTHIDSSAITLIVNYCKRLADKGGMLVAFAPNADIQGIFDIVGVEKSMTVYTTRENFEAAQ